MYLIKMVDSIDSDMLINLDNVLYVFPDMIEVEEEQS